MNKVIYLLRPYRGWISDRQLWQPGKMTLPEDAANYLVNAGYAEFEHERREKRTTKQENEKTA